VSLPEDLRSVRGIRLGEQQSLTAFSRTDRTVSDYGVYSGHPAGPWPADTDSDAL